MHRILLQIEMTAGIMHPRRFPMLCHRVVLRGSRISYDGRKTCGLLARRRQATLCTLYAQLCVASEQHTTGHGTYLTIQGSSRSTTQLPTTSKMVSIAAMRSPPNTTLAYLSFTAHIPRLRRLQRRHPRNYCTSEGVLCSRTNRLGSPSPDPISHQWPVGPTPERCAQVPSSPRDTWIAR